MKFEIEFNNRKGIPFELAEKVLNTVGRIEYSSIEYSDSKYVTEINTLEELIKLQKDVHRITGDDQYWLLVDFDGNPTIFFDNIS